MIDAKKNEAVFRMHRNLAMHHKILPVLALGTLALSIGQGQQARAQIFLSPNQHFPQRPRLTVELEQGVRCSIEGGASPSLSFSIGAYPDLIFDNVVVNPTSSSAAQQS